MHSQIRICRLAFLIVTTIALLPISGVALAAASPAYTATQLPNLGASGSWAESINNSGQMVGWLEYDGGVYSRAVLWQGDSVIDLGLGDNSVVMDINESGVIVGRNTMGPVRIINLVSSSIGSLGGVYGSANAINEQGQITGGSFAIPQGSGIARHAYRYTSGSMTDLGTLGGFSNSIYSEGTGINDSGWVVGQSSTASAGGNSYGFVHRGLAMEALPSIYLDKNHSAADINNNGIIVGAGIDQFGLTLPQRALLWEGDSVISIHGSISRQHSQASAINERGDIVGSAWNAGAPFGAAYVWMAETRIPISLNNVSTGLDGWFLTNALDINECGQIVCAATKNDSTHAFLLSPTPEIIIASPAVNELWIPGQQHTISWFTDTSGCAPSGVDSVSISYSLNFDGSGGTFQTIVDAFPFDSGMYVWDVPDTLFSPRCAIALQSTQHLGFSGTFRIRDYELARITPDTNYERFEVAEHGWSFSNAESNMWPESWYQSQYDYLFATDPFTGKLYPAIFPLSPLWARSKNFPSWVGVVWTYGIDEMYANAGQAAYWPKSLLFWKGIKGNWGGSCFGFAVSTNLVFRWRDGFLSAFSDIGLAPELGSAPLAYNSRQLINQLFVHQFGAEFRRWTRSHRNTTPVETFNQIRNNFASDVADVQALHIYNQNGGGGHAVNPYKIVKHPINAQAYWLYVYDNNAPGDTTRRITIDTVANTWHYNGLPAWGGSRGMLADQPAYTYFFDPVQPSSREHHRRIGFEPAAIPDSTVMIFSPAGTWVHIEGSAGDSAGFEGGLAYSEMAGAYPVTPLTGFEQPPLGFDLLNEPYSIRLYNYPDSAADLTVLGDSLAFAYSRIDADSNQTDLFQFDAAAHSLTASNLDVVAKHMSWQTVIALDLEERVFDLDDLVMNAGDSLSMQELGQSDLFITNLGAEQNTPLQLTRTTAAGATSARVASFTLPARASARLLPEWDSLINSPITAWLDYDLDGSVDDTVLLNIATSTSGNHSALPVSFELAQNYPNPFNASTSIQYSMASPGEMSLEVFNILGQRVIELASGFQTPGSYTVSWNGTNQAGHPVASGVYFYRINTGDLQAVRSMLLLK